MTPEDINDLTVKLSCNGGVDSFDTSDTSDTEVSTYDAIKVIGQ